MMDTPGLVIFDCDGVLIDSEIVVCRLVGEELGRLGYDVSVEQVIERYAGRPEREMVADIEHRWGRKLPDEYYRRIRQATNDAYGRELEVIPGAPEVLRAIRARVCVASSSYPEKLRLGLETAGLYQLVAPNLVSASWVAHGKPAPDVFIYAAGWMRVPVTECVVVEDSIPGVTAARQAGMRVLGFVGGSHCRPAHRERLLEAGAEHVLSHMAELTAVLPGAF